jgi:hypothetical protein
MLADNLQKAIQQLTFWIIGQISIAGRRKF